MKSIGIEASNVGPLAIVACGVLLAWSSGTRAQTSTPSFLANGYIEEFTLDNSGDRLSSAVVKVGGRTIKLPANLLITMPGQYLTAHDLFRGPHPGNGSVLASVRAQTGLALADTPAPKRPVTMHISGNIVDGIYIAGVAAILPQGANPEGEGSGYIRSIDYSKGEMVVGAPTGSGSFTRVRINDPQGVYGKTNAGKPGGSAMDDRFSVDPENAPVVAATGYPMCIPRVAPPGNDPLCPTVNRPPQGSGSQLAARFTCGTIPAPAIAPPWPACQPKQAAPLVPGDYITYFGMNVVDPAGGEYFAASAVHAHVGIYTSPGTNPAYVLIEVSLVGTLGEPFPGVDQEQTSRFRVVGFTTDPTRDVDVFAMDVGGRERLLTRLTPITTGPIGRFRITLPAKSNFLPVTRDIRARIAGHTSVAVVGGHLSSGQFTIPVAEYLAPEDFTWGQSRHPVAIPFENFCFLAGDDGPLTTLGRSEGTVHRLDPFPNSGHPLSQARANGTLACN